MKASEHLSKITMDVISSVGQEDEIASCKALARYCMNFDYMNDISDQQVNGGIAISVGAAAKCIHDYIRTARFIKGVYVALLKALQKHETVNVLYAGCGPYGILLLPILTIFAEQGYKGRIKAVLMDVNEHSFIAVRFVISGLHLEPFIVGLSKCDASNTELPLNRYEVAIVETMFTALTREPQVTITEKLALITDELIPNEVTVRLVYTNYVLRHPHNMSHKDYIDKGVVLMLNKSHIRKVMDTDWMPIEFHENYSDICLFTTIKVHDQITLEVNESEITGCFHLANTSLLKGKTEMRLHYYTGTCPKWEIEVR